MTTPHEAFLEAINTIKTLSKGPNALRKPSNDRKVHLYGLYKQATEGNVEGIMPRPEGPDLLARAGQQKWDAWKSCEGMAKSEAKLRYVEFLLETMQLSAANRPDRPWRHLEATLRQARASAEFPIHVNKPTNDFAPPEIAQLPNNLEKRRQSVGSLNSSYSRIARSCEANAPITSSSRKLSEFGLSEKECSERQADQLVDQLQSAYPPVIPGAVSPLYGSFGSEMPIWYRNGFRYPPISDSHPNSGQPNGGTGWVLQYWIYLANSSSWALEKLLKLIIKDAAKLCVLLLVIRLTMAQSNRRLKSPVLQRCVQTAGKLAAVLLNAFDIEIRMKSHRKLPVSRS